MGNPSVSWDHASRSSASPLAEAGAAVLRVGVRLQAPSPGARHTDPAARACVDRLTTTTG